MTPGGKAAAAANLLSRGIDGLVVLGGTAAFGAPTTCIALTAFRLWEFQPP
jgi:hypothetical protein